MTLVKPFSMAALAGLGAVAMVLVHDDGNAWVQLGSGEHQVAEVVVLRIGAGPPTGLDNHGRVGLLGRLHDRLNLFHIVHVEGCQAVVILGGVIQ